ncbi:MAG TPA: pantoate--beta-alanine ligase [Flavisolibacter sp.]
MIIFKSAESLAAHLYLLRNEGKKIGFVPTMGALHRGHMSLIDQSGNENEVTVCSIFINPTQFTNEADFQHYPVTIESDIEALQGAGCDILFLPAQSEIYTESFVTRHFELGRLEELLEGHFRPGHFQGVCQVVDRLLQIVPAHTLYLGQKDYQQCMVIARLLQITGREKEVKLAIVPTVREPDGLAMSSRNLRLSPAGREQASAIAEVLYATQSKLSVQNFEALKQEASKFLTARGFSVDYVEIADARTLETASGPGQPLVALVAASVGGIRLIDNLILN